VVFTRPGQLKFAGADFLHIGAKVILLKLGVCHRGRYMRTLTAFFDDLAGVDWLSVAGLYTLAFFSILIVTVALMFGATLLFWARYPDDLHL
jgi:hypothetical protein